MHVHHWLIESPNGSSTVQGKCKTCRKTREFEVAQEYSGDWNNGVATMKKGIPYLHPSDKTWVR